jgi:Fe-S cluster assembly protein SufD
MTAVAEQIGAWLDSFTNQPAAEPWIQELREAAFRRFTELGFPTTHDEEWRFTNVAPIARTRFTLSGVRPSGALKPVPQVDFAVAPAATFMNGRLISALPKGADGGTPDDLEKHLARHASFEKNAFLALNTAFLRDVAVVRIDRGAVVDQPIHLVYLIAGGSEAAAIHPRTLIKVGADAHCTIVETYVGTGPYFTNAVTEIVAGEGAAVDHYKVQEESLAAFHIATMQVTLGRSANFTSHSISIGGALVRNDANATLSEGTEATLNGLYIVNGKQHVDNHTVIDHAKPHGTSHEMYKGILDDKSSAVFNGRIIVRKDAQKTDSKQTNKNLVLSDDAVIDTKPELQILADDVRCTHGATIGQLDAEALFYLQSRGIGKSQARDVLTYAFAQDIIDRIKVPALKDHLEKVLFEKFHERSE